MTVAEHTHHDATVTWDGRILAAKQRDAEANTRTLEREIEELVYALYRLTPEEKAIVNGATK
jgi:hypothetical protein